MSILVQGGLCMHAMPGMTSMTPKQAVYWRKNQVIVTFLSPLSVQTRTLTIVQFVDDQLQQLNIQALEKATFLLSRRKSSQGVADPSGGIFVYSTPNRSMGDVHLADIAVVCTIMPKPEHIHDAGMPENDEASRQIVKILNDFERTNAPTVSFRAMPNWLWSGVPDETHGCPVTPPFPANNQDRTGRWRTVFPAGLPKQIQESTGAGVTIFLLDAFPQPEQIQQAAKRAGAQNTLLQDLTQGLVSDGSGLANPPAISLDYTYTIPGPAETAVTGKDIYGRLSGFPMADHGLFIAGLIRDLAPDASLACIRVLNDFGVGDSATLIQALTSIETRLREDGDLFNKSVVINLSLVVGPPECDLDRLNLTAQKDKHSDRESLPELLSGLYNLLASIDHLGGIITCSVGNDSDPRDFMMNPFEVRFGARYPAAFANRHPDYTPLDLIIPVGAANQEGKPAAYSNYPGSAGFATYGGELPRPKPWIPSAIAHRYAQVDTSDGLDALYGVYSGRTYPALSRNDRYLAKRPGHQTSAEPTYPWYNASSHSGWACWSGTSFSTPIITALVARAIQSAAGSPYGENIRKLLTNAGHPIDWDGLTTGEDTLGILIMATQAWHDEPPDTLEPGPYADNL